jgi:epoxide hydrolase-like predicted phosphatase
MREKFFLQENMKEFLFILFLGLSCMQLHSIEEIIFDFGGVLGETKKELVAEGVQQQLDISYEEALSLIKEAKQAHRKGVSKKKFWKSYAEKTGTTLPDNWLETLDELKLQAIVKNPESYELVTALQQRGYKLAILSNTTTERASYIREMGGYDQFNPVILSCEIDVKKPADEAFEALLQCTGMPPNACLFIDDKEQNVEAARRLGFDAIHFQSIEQLRTELEQRGILKRSPRG